MPSKRIAKPTPATATIDLPLIGRDEMNLADHPLSVLTDRADTATKTLIFRNPHGTLTITGSDAHGAGRRRDGRDDPAHQAEERLPGAAGLLHPL
jgi:hypothetical protein